MSVQKYETHEQAIFYDLEDYLSQAIQNQSAITAFKQQMSKTVIYRDFTPYFLGGNIDNRKSCGISVYVSSSTDGELDEQYKHWIGIKIRSYCVNKSIIVFLPTSSTTGKPLPYCVPAVSL